MRGIKMWRWWGCLAGGLELAMVVEGDWWQPGPGVNWDWRLAGSPKATTGVGMYDIDLFDVPQSEMQALRKAGIYVICYFSAGTYEEYREDEDQFPRSALGFPIEDAEGEWWVNINDQGIKTVMMSRLDLAVTKGCDGVEPDAIEVYSYGVDVSGWDISADDQLTYNKWIADQAHERNLSVALKNDALQVVELQPWFDWALSTDCYSEGTCDIYAPFLAAGKAVVDAEFEVMNLDLCNSTEAESIDFIVKGYDLDELRCSCGFPETNMDCDYLLSINNPTEAPTVAGGDEDGGEDASEEEEEGTATWVIVTAIAMVVLMAMMAYGAVLYRRRKTKLKGGVQGVDDFM